MKKEGKIIVICCIILLFVGLTGCAGIGSNQFVGTWTYGSGWSSSSISFLSDGTCSAGGIKGNWKISDNKLTITMGGTYMSVYDYSFSNAGDTLTLDGSGGMFLSNHMVLQKVGSTQKNEGTPAPPIG